MRIALHPTINEPIDMDRYIKMFGRRPILQEDNRERARCPFCPERLNDVAGRTGDTTSHFAHFPDSGPCPSKEPAGRPYLRLTPTARNPEGARRLKQLFWENWALYYSELRNLVPFLSKNEFFALIREANQLRVWEYHNLISWEIPYVFVLMNDFPGLSRPKNDNNNFRKFWFRFWYDSSVRELDDLWINRHGEPVLFRASFIQPRQRGVIPGIDKIVKFYPIERDHNYLDKPLPRPLPEWLSREVEDVLPRLLGLGL